MTDEQEVRLHMAAMDYRGARPMSAEEPWKLLVEVVEELMRESAEAAVEHYARHEQ